jgi:hypothetical protein
VFGERHWASSKPRLYCGLLTNCVVLCYFEMTSFNISCPDVPGGSGCLFVGRGPTLSSARRALRGHALRHHGAIFEEEGRPLCPTTPEDLARRLTTFRRSQMSAAQRRSFDQELLSRSSSVAGGSGSAAGGVSGLSTGLRLVRGPAVAGDGGPPPRPVGRWIRCCGVG